MTCTRRATARDGWKGPNARDPNARCDPPHDRTARPCRAPERAVRPILPRCGRLAHPPRRAVRVACALAGTVVTAAALLVAATPTTASAVDVFGALRLPGEAAFIVGHRGDRAEAPENTMASLELAMDDLAFVETDVQLSRDGVPMLFHDTTLERVAGDPRSVGELDLADLRRLDVGAWYGRDHAGERMPDARRVPHRARRAAIPPARSSSSRPTGIPRTCAPWSTSSSATDCADGSCCRASASRPCSPCSACRRRPRASC